MEYSVITKAWWLFVFSRSLGPHQVPGGRGDIGVYEKEQEIIHDSYIPVCARYAGVLQRQKKVFISSPRSVSVPLTHNQLSPQIRQPKEQAQRQDQTEERVRDIDPSIIYFLSSFSFLVDDFLRVSVILNVFFFHHSSSFITSTPRCNGQVEGLWCVGRTETAGTLRFSTWSLAIVQHSIAATLCKPNCVESASVTL